MKYLFAVAILLTSFTAFASPPHKVETIKNWRGQTTAWIFTCHIHGSTDPRNDLGHCVSTPSAKECAPPYADTLEAARAIAEKECEKADK